MKSELGSEDSSDQLEKDSDITLRCLLSPEKKASEKREAFVYKKRPRAILSDEESDKLLVTPRKKASSSSVVVERSSVGLRKRKRKSVVEKKKISRSKHVESSDDDEVEEDESEVKIEVLEYSEDDLANSKKTNKVTESGGGHGRKRLKIEEGNRGIDDSDEEKPEIEEDKRIRSAGKSKEQLKVWCKSRIKVEGEGGDSPVDKKKKVVRPDKSCNDLSEAEENRSSRAAGSPIGRRTRSSVKLESKVEDPSPPKLAEKSKLPKGFPAKKKNKKQQRHLTRARKDSSLQAGSENVDNSVKAKGKKGKAISTTAKGLSSKLPGKKMGKLNMEKELIRDQIRKMLDSAGWTIDYRPRMHKDYNDAVYVDLKGGTYWSIVKAYCALEKHWENQKHDRYASGFTFVPIPEEIIDKLTRRTKQRIAREKMMKKGKANNENKKAEGITEKVTAEKKHLKKSKGSSMKKEKLNCLIKQDGESIKARMKKKGFKLNRKDAVKRPKSANSSVKVGNDLHNGGPKPAEAYKASLASNAHLRRGRKSKTQRGYTLLVRKPDKEADSTDDHFVAYDGKRTILSWLIDSEVLSLGGKVKYMNKKHTRALLEGLITRDGINCGCCNEIVSISEFETHAGSELRQPWQNIYVETGFSLYQCQIDAWNKQEDSKRSGFHCIDTTIGDPSDDACGICGDGGDLICCDGCPSTFHQGCLGIQELPKGDWRCFNCCCKFCGVVDCSDGKGDGATISNLLTCSLCEEKYHGSCIPEGEAVPVALDGLHSSFCGQKCRELFEQLQKLLGVKHEVEGGFSWTIIQRSDLDSVSSLCGLPQKVECNSKLALALSVLDECFLPNVEERSGINLIHNVVYNCGSNFKRLNYSGFYTFLLEKGDDLISAASIRLHGTRFAEMPFIGTRYIYRRQGMCRRLLNAIESSLSSLNVEKLIIPAISELMDTWTTVFGFSPMEESYKNEVRFLNMLVFPGVGLLEKLPLKHSSADATLTDGSVFKAVEQPINEATDNSDTVFLKPENLASDVISDEVVITNTDLQSPGDLIHDTSNANNSSNVLGEHNSHVTEETLCCNSKPLHESLSETNSLLSEAVENPTMNCSTKSNTQASMEGAVDDTSKILDGVEQPTTEATDNSLTVSVKPDNLVCDEVTGKVGTAITGMQARGGPIIDTSDGSNLYDVPGEQISHATEEIAGHNSQSLHGSMPETNSFLPEAEENHPMNCSIESNPQISIEGVVNDPQKLNIKVDGVDLRYFAETSSFHKTKETSTDGTDLKAIKLEGNYHIPAEATDNSDTGSVDPDNLASDMPVVNYANGTVGKIFNAKTCLQESGNPVQDISDASNPLDDPSELTSHAPKEKIVCHNSQSQDSSL